MTLMLHQTFAAVHLKRAKYDTMRMLFLFSRIE
jgi:hypothetical protein